jgi:hypothetical protein
MARNQGNQGVNMRQDHILISAPFTVHNMKTVTEGSVCWNENHWKCGNVKEYYIRAVNKVTGNLVESQLAEAHNKSK